MKNRTKYLPVSMDNCYNWLVELGGKRISTKSGFFVVKKQP